MARLIVLAGKNIGESYELGQTNSLGSGDANAVIIPDPAVSEYHAQLSQIKKRFYIVNLTVTDTIEVNGREIEKIMLSNGDSLKLGSTTFLFSDEHEEKSDDEDVMSQSSELKEMDFGKYKIIEEISRGANAVVYKAVQKGLDRIVALKVMLSGEFAGRDEINRFYSEARAVASLTHPNIVPIFDIGVYNKRHYFAMEYIEGQTLGAALETKDISPLRGLKAIEQVANALAYAHKRSIVHRDIKPTNILIDNFGKALLSDFGIAKQLGAGNKTNTQTGQALGTPAYMPPEQAEGKIRISPRSDIYSLGAVLYEIFTGQKPYDASSAAAILMKVLTEDPIPPQKVNPQMNPDVATIISKAMERMPERRYQSAKAMAEDIAAFRRGQQIKAKPTSKYYYLMQSMKKNAMAITAISISLMSTVASLFYMNINSKNAKRQIHKIEIEKEKVVFAAKKAAKQTKREETSRWHIADNSSQNNFANWTRSTSQKSKTIIIDSVLLSDENDVINLNYDREHNGNLQIDFAFKTPDTGGNIRLSGFIGKTSHNGLQFIFGKWQDFEMVIMRGGKILAMRKIDKPEAGQVINISFKLQGLQAWLVARYDDATPTALTYRGLEILQVPYKRKAGITLNHSDGELANLKIRYEDLPLKPTRLDFAHTYFFKGDLNEAYNDYMQISKSLTYKGDAMAVEALYYAGLTLEAQRKYTQAHKIFESIIKAKNLNAPASEIQIQYAILQNVFALAHIGEIKSASNELKKLIKRIPSQNITTPWEWEFVDLLPKYYNTGHYSEALDIIKSIQWCQGNLIVEEKIKTLATRICNEKPYLMAQLIELYPHKELLPTIKKTLTKLTKKHNWQQLNHLRNIIITNNIADTELKNIFKTQLINALNHNGDIWTDLLSYFYNKNTDDTIITTAVSNALDYFLNKKQFDKCVEIYKRWPSKDFFHRFVTFELANSNQSLSAFLKAENSNLNLAIEILMENSQYEQALIIANKALNNQPNNITILLKQATLLEILDDESALDYWENIAKNNTASFIGEIAGLFAGELDADDIRLKYAEVEPKYLIDFYIGLYELNSNNANIARVLLQRSLINNPFKQWPYHLCRQMLKKANKQTDF